DPVRLEGGLRDGGDVTDAAALPGDGEASSADLEPLAAGAGELGDGGEVAADDAADGRLEGWGRRRWRLGLALALGSPLSLPVRVAHAAGLVGPVAAGDLAGALRGGRGAVRRS